MSTLELKVPPLVLVTLTAAGMWLAARLSSRPDFLFPGVGWLAAVLVLTGLAIAVLGVAEFRRAGTTVDPRVPEKSAALVTGGVFQYSRNPMYAGFVLVLLGWALVLGSWWSLTLLPAFVIYMNRFQITPEERLMQARFGTAYCQYRSSVRRWI